VIHKKVRHIGVVKVYLHSFLTSALDGVVNITPRPLYPQEKNPDTHCVGSRSGLDVFGSERNLLPLMGFEIGSVQSVE
jgi:hypothetical protein